MKMTIKDIAREANVSVTTVSFVLNGKAEKISAETIRKVKAIADRNNYVPNVQAVGLVTRKTKTIGLIIPDIENMFFSALAKHIETAFLSQGYNIFLMNTNDILARDLESIELLNNRNVDGIIISLSKEATQGKNMDKIYTALKLTETPFVIVDRDIPRDDCAKVLNDDVFGGYLATKHLIDRGHMNIACITGPMTVSSAAQRLQGYRQAIEEAGIAWNEELVLEGDYQFESGYQHASALLKKDITAIFACNDLMAYGVYRACLEIDYRVPQDISLVGFDDLMFSSILEVPLTSVKQNAVELSEKIVATMLGQFNGEPIDMQLMIKPSLTERSSVADAKRSV